MAFGVMGGQYQATGHMQILSGVLDRGLDIQQSSDAPRSFAFDGTLSLEPTVSGSVADDLIARGHRVTWAEEPLGGFQAVQVDSNSGIMYGASDHRKDGIALAA